MFDLDCPSTPDGGDDGPPKPKTGAGSAAAAPHRHGGPGSGRPPLRSAPPRTTPRGASRKAYTPRARPKRPAGLEPEEFVVPPPPRAAAPGSSGGTSAYRAAPTSGGSGGGGDVGVEVGIGGILGGGGGGAAIFDDGGRGGVAAGNHRGGHRRSGSGTWWREEIIDEDHDKGEVMEKYYGLKPGQKQELYGRTNAGNATANGPGSSTNPFDDDVEEGGGAPREMPPRPHQAVGLVHSGVRVQVASAATKMYDRAPSATNAGHVDDYSFSDVRLSSPGNSPGAGPGVGLPGGAVYPIRPTHPGPAWAANPANPGNKNDATLLQKFWSAVAGGPKNDAAGYLPPNMTPETNIAPRPRGSSAEWHPSSPKVTFTNDFAPCSIKKDRWKGWNSLTPVQKMGAATVWAALLCVVFGVTISQLRGPGGAVGGNESGSQAVSMPVIDATADPTGAPTTPRPTRTPTTESPISGYYAIHDKRHDGTPHPTRSPITPPPTETPTTADPTAGPTKGPTEGPTGGPTAAPTGSPSVAVEAVQSAPVTCEDEAGEFANHLANPKTCAWLDSKMGFTDRKDKNCGGRAVPDGFGGTVTYPTTVLGSRCQRTCRLYNECPDVVLGITAFGGSDPAVGAGSSSSSTSCMNEAGLYLNHLDNPKDCAWLHNGKEGFTDRKDKNCGGRLVTDESGATAIYPTTPLGRRCKRTCGPYNGCSGEAVPPNAAAHNRCQDRKGLYPNHLLNPKDCAWLRNGKEGFTDRKDKNCGTGDHPSTALGRACAATCGPYRPPGDACAVVGKLTVEGGHVMRSFSSPGYSFSQTVPLGGAACVDGEGAYANQKGVTKPCAWLTGHGDDRHGGDDVTRHRQEKNCGSTVHAVTELGKECPWSCREYNVCGS